MALACLNCGGDVAQENARIFAGVFCCPVCHERAERLEKRIQAQLKQLYTMTREGIRVAMTEGKLHFGDDKDQDVSKADLLRNIMQIEQIREARKGPPVAVGPAVGPDGRPLKRKQ